MPFTNKDRKLALKISIEQRRKQQAQRRKKVRKMFDSGMSKTAIAKELGVARETVWKDLKEG
ncbi:MAG: helix-turn-helix domain-containing protein [Candidatus Poribacteria bacterium]|nr:helix-turn-helix domain-containing protein [Candidatus Poribacteria bacterium]